MSRKFYFSFLAFALTLSATVAFVVGHSTGTSAASPNTAALSALPASDFVISIDVQRALNETLPSIFAANPALLAKMNAKLDEFQTKTGINPRSFESLAIGGHLTASKPRDSQTVVIARGSFNSDELLETAFAAAKAKGEKFQKEEQQYEGRRIVLVSSTRTAKDDIDAGKTIAQLSTGRRGEKMAIAVLDSNTLAVGNLESVMAAVDASLGRNRVDDELVRLATETPNAVVGFSGTIPPGYSGKLSAADNSFEKYFASVRQFYGSFSADGTDAEAAVALRTDTTEQASEIGQALNTLKSLSTFGFARSGGGATQSDSLADLLKGLSITTQGNEVHINVRVPQTSVAPLVRTF